MPLPMPPPVVAPPVLHSLAASFEDELRVSVKVFEQKIIETLRREVIQPIVAELQQKVAATSTLRHLALEGSITTGGDDIKKCPLPAESKEFEDWADGPNRAVGSPCIASIRGSAEDALLSANFPENGGGENGEAMVLTVRDEEGSQDSRLAPKVFDTFEEMERQTSELEKWASAKSAAAAVIAAHRMQKLMQGTKASRTTQISNSVETTGSGDNNTAESAQQPLEVAPLQTAWLVDGGDLDNDDDSDEDEEQEHSRKSIRQSTSNQRRPPEGSLNKDKKRITASKLAKNGQSFVRFFVIPSSSSPALLWDFWTAFAILSDMLLMPMDVFELPKGGFIGVMETLSTSTWIIDMVLTFFRSYPGINGEDETRITKIWLRYWKSWFAFDFMLVAMDIVMILLAESSWLSYLQFMRAIRLVRLLRMVRLLKLKSRLKFLSNIVELLRLNNISQLAELTEQGKVLVQMFKNLVMIVMITHFIACLWYGIGMLSQETENSWVLSYRSKYGVHSQLALYLVSYHWSLAQFTPASMEVVPTDIAERIFAIMTLLFGLCLFSSFISTMTQQMTRLKDMARDEQTRNDKLRRYMIENNISLKLSTTVLNFIRQKKTGGEEHRPVPLIEVEKITGCPEYLVTKLREESAFARTSLHAVFDFLAYEGEIWSNICKDTISDKIYKNGDCIFQTNAKGESMIFVTYGKLAYYKQTSDVLALMSKAESSGYVEKNQTVGEAALWLYWRHMGSLYCDSSFTDCVQVNMTEFQKAVSTSSVSRDVIIYARLYFLRLNRAATENVDSVDDLWAPQDVLEEIGRLALFGGLDSSLKALGSGSMTPDKVFKAWAFIAVSDRGRWKFCSKYCSFFGKAFRTFFGKGRRR